MTWQLLWMEYKAQAGELAMGYSHLCRCYREWKNTRRLSMRQEHRADEKLFIDFCGPTLSAIIPTRSYKPKVGNGVLIMEIWLLALIRNENFYTLRALNIRLRELLTDMNHRPMKGYGNRTCAEHFRVQDASGLSAFPLVPYEYTEFKAVKAAADYHVEYAHHWYSVPYELVGRRLSLKSGPAVVWCKGGAWRSIRIARMNINTPPIRCTCRGNTGGREAVRQSAWWRWYAVSVRSPAGLLKPC